MINPCAQVRCEITASGRHPNGAGACCCSPAGDSGQPTGISVSSSGALTIPCINSDLTKNAFCRSTSPSLSISHKESILSNSTESYRMLYRLEVRLITLIRQSLLDDPTRSTLRISDLFSGEDPENQRWRQRVDGRLKFHFFICQYTSRFCWSI